MTVQNTHPRILPVEIIYAYPQYNNECSDFTIYSVEAVQVAISNMLQHSFPNFYIDGVSNPAWASGPSEVLRYFTCSGSPVQDCGFESLRNFRKGRLYV